VSHADQTIRARHAALNAAYPVIPDELVLSDEPTGDFGIAAFHGLDPEGRALLSFDAGYESALWTIDHELAHAINAVCGRRGEAAVRYFWALRGFPGTIESATDASNSAPTQRREWELAPTEAFAECFKACIREQGAPDSWETTEVYGAPLTAAKRAEMRAFYAALRPSPYIAPPEEEMVRIIGGIDITTDAQGHGRRRLDLAGLTYGKPISAIAVREGLTGAESRLPDIGVGVAAVEPDGKSFVNIHLRGDHVAPGTAYVRLTVLQ